MSIVTLVGRGVAWNSAAIVIGKILMLANVFLILGFLTVYEYGFSELVLSTVSMIGIVLLPGLAGVVISDMSVDRGKGNTERMSLVFHQYFLLISALSVGAWTVLFFGSQPVAEFAGNPYAAQFLQIASFTFLLTPLRSATQILATVLMRFFDQSFYVIFEELFKFVCILVLIVWLGLGIKGLVLSIVLAQLLGVLAFLPRTLSAYATLPQLPFSAYAKAWDMLREHRKWSIGTSHVGTLSQNARLWIIKFMLGTEAVGLFSFALGVYSHVASLIPLTGVLTPIIPHYVSKKDQLARILRASVKFQIVVSVVCTAIAMIASKPFVSILFPHYLPALPIVYAVLVAVVFNSVFVLLPPVFAAFKLQRSLLGSAALKGVLMLIILPPSIILFGLTGTGIEIALTTLLNGLERYRRVKKLVPAFSLAPTDLLKTDAYERQAMQTVARQFRSSFRSVFRFF